MFDLVVDPDRFFERKLSGDDFIRPAVLVGLTGLIGIAGPLVVLEALLGSVEGETGYFVVGYAIGLIGTFLGPFLEWMLLSLGFYILSIRFASRGDLREVVRLGGWGFLPAVVGGIGVLVAITHAVSRISPPGKQAQIMTYIRTVQSDPTVELGMWLGVLFMVWSGFLWVFALKHARGVSVRQAVPCVTLPVAVTVIWRLYQLL